MSVSVSAWVSHTWPMGQTPLSLKRAVAARGGGWGMSCGSADLLVGHQRVSHPHVTHPRVGHASLLCLPVGHHPDLGHHPASLGRSGMGGSALQRPMGVACVGRRRFYWGPSGSVAAAVLLGPPSACCGSCGRALCRSFHLHRCCHRCCGKWVPSPWPRGRGRHGGKTRWTERGTQSPM